MFELITDKTPSGDQQKAIDELVKGVENNKKAQVLLGATGTGKTFTIANVINKVQKKTLVMVHNKTLAGQLYQELKSLFPNNHVEYFISYFDFYQPEAYLPSSDTYIEKSSKTNEEIAMMRLSTLNSLANYDDVIVVASVAAIYASVSKSNFKKFQILLKVGDDYGLDKLKSNLVNLKYHFNNIDLKPGNFRVNGDVVDISLGYCDEYIIRVSFFGNEIEKITKVDPLTGDVIEKIKAIAIAPAEEYIADIKNDDDAFKQIEQEMKDQIKYFKQNERLIEAQRIEQRTKYDMEAIKEFGYCSGIENYARYFENRKPGETPYTILDFFGDDWLLVVDESHISLPQFRGMYETDRSRKTTLVDYGFRLPSALDNRPLKFNEIQAKIDKAIYVSATPNEYEINQANNQIVEQIVRPTFLLDPEIEIRNTKNQIEDLINDLFNQRKKNQRTFISVMTIRMAEELTALLQLRNIKVAYLHNELKTLERAKIINDLRRGKYEAIVGINLLREGIDAPEVSLVSIFDADKPGLFRNEKALIQMIGRAARNIDGRVVLYADKITTDMQKAIDETNRRRAIQIAYNKEHNITPQTIIKPIYDDLSFYDLEQDKDIKDKKQLSISQLKKMMLKAAKDQNYELAAKLRDQIIELSNLQDIKNKK